MEIKVSGITGIGKLPRSFFKENVSLEEALFSLLESNVRVLFLLPINQKKTSFKLVITGSRRKPICKNFEISVERISENNGEFCLTL